MINLLIIVLLPIAVILKIYELYVIITRKYINLHVLVDSSERICYTGEYKDLIDKKTPELKLIELTGVYK